MKKTHGNYKADYSIAIKTLGYGTDEIESMQETDINEELARQLERESKSAAQYPESYRLVQIMSSASGRSYRSGADSAEPYMTYEDYMRLIVAETKIPEYGKDPSKVSHCAERPATVYNVRGIVKAGAGEASALESVIDGEGHYVARVEGSDTTAGGNLTKIFDRWFPATTVVKPDRKIRRRIASPVAGIAWVMIFALMLALPITLNVLKSEASSQLLQKQDQLAALEQEEKRLEAEFESSIDLREIENVAVNEYGMIKLNQSTIRVLRLNDTDSIESFSETKKSTFVPALLSALGIRSGNE